ncbi:malto-oligosyltrehalose trehalohydrolase [Frateuria terrea]|uniref:Malto-oligosyltrehalose trehalohydrolase n=1 Tax=Frateuria terrea TaxID=529704 RepID=A0A1H6UI59_9GAMM|nr:malto-oligosyltrehalose trehalohydrolase [Frateuria terrea]SEI90434.1 maltooligosyltrehalose trehalohydrolase [Frateuria terrea]SFP36518.1 maltooligosyltrehalose trehalohydrolase [Frateuria terrea]
MSGHFRHAMPYGAELQGDGNTRFRLWAPDAARVQLEIGEGARHAMRALGDGWHQCVHEAPAGTPYRYILRDGLSVPDPASRLQQAGDVHGASLVVDPAAYDWQHALWKGRPWREAVVYELHVGACGGFRGVQSMLPGLHALGVTAIELMPVAQFPGRRNWGYDGVLPFAPAGAYGTPEELKALVDAAHGLGLMMILDVVYNHFGPDGNYLGEYASPFFRSDGPPTPWGAAIDVARPPVGDFFVHNALYWLQEYRFDGLRLDAVHALHDPSWLLSLAARVRAAAGERQLHLLLENEANQAHLLGPDRFDAQWNDDFHNALHVLLTGETAGYYGAYAEDPIGKLVRCLAEGFAWQGEPMRGTPRGEPSAGLSPLCFVDFLQNHDQVGNRALGERLTVLADPKLLEAAYALLLLTPTVPMLFMGEEWGSRAPFLFFADHQNEALRTAVREGRRKEFAEFEGHGKADVPDPNARSSFERSRPDPHEAATPAGIARLTLIRLLLSQRRQYLLPRLQQARPLGARALGARALDARWQLGDARLHVYCNLGRNTAAVDARATADARWLHGEASAIAALAEGRLAPTCTLVCLEPSA